MHGNFKFGVAWCQMGTHPEAGDFSNNAFLRSVSMQGGLVGGKAKWDKMGMCTYESKL